MILEMILEFAMSIFMCRTVLSVYDKDEAKMRYITIQNPWLAKILVGRTDPWSGRKLRKKDGNKLPVVGAVGYLLNLIALLIWGLSAVAPIRPSSPLIIDSEDWPTQLDTGNQKVSYAAIMLVFCLEIGAICVRAISWVRKGDMHIASKCIYIIGLFFGAIVAVVCGAWLSLDILLSI